MTQPRLPDKRTNYQKNTRGSFQGSFAPIVYRDRDPTSGTPNVDLRDPFKGRMYPVGQQWMNTTDNLLWILVDVTANTPTWQKVDMNTVGDGIDTVTGDDSIEVGPDVAGNINLTGETVANATNAKPVYFEGNAGTFTENLQVQVGAAIAEPADKNDAGLSSYDLAFFTQDTNGWVSWKGAAGPQSGDHNNLSLAYSAGTATIQGANGNALSATNPAFVSITSNANPDRILTHKLTSNVTFDDSAGSSSNFVDSLFGFLTGDTTSTVQGAIPFWILAAAENSGAATPDTNVKFFVSRLPWRFLNATFLEDGQSGDADDGRSIISLEVLGGSLSDYEGSTAIIVGQFTMDINGSDDWTIDSFEGGPFGFGKYNPFNNVMFDTGLMGASASSHFFANSGTAPTESTSNYFYKIDHSSNFVIINVHLVLSGSPAGAVDAQMVLPIFGQANSNLIIGEGYFFDGGASGNVYPVIFMQTAQFSNRMYLLKADGTSARWQYDEFSSGDIITANFTYRLN